MLVSRLLGYNLFAYCENNPVIRRDPTGMFFFGDSISIEDDFALEGAGEGGSGASSNLMGAGTMYHTARIRGNSATYDVCGYVGFPNFSSSGVNTSTYIGASTKNISVTDSMATNGGRGQTSSFANSSKINTYSGRSLSPEGQPNSISCLYFDGQLKQQRIYGPNGKAIMDIDYFHPGPNHKFPHVHIFDWSIEDPRGDAINLFS